MSAESNEADGHELALDHHEAWVLHHAVLDHVELEVADNETLPTEDLELLEKIEAGSHIYTQQELHRIWELCEAHRLGGDTPDSDEQAARSLIEEIDRTLPDESVGGSNR